MVLRDQYDIVGDRDPSLLSDDGAAGGIVAGAAEGQQQREGGEERHRVLRYGPKRPLLTPEALAPSPGGGDSRAVYYAGYTAGSDRVAVAAGSVRMSTIGIEIGFANGMYEQRAPR